jgi:hypothetical protein
VVVGAIAWAGVAVKARAGFGAAAPAEAELEATVVRVITKIAAREMAAATEPGDRFNGSSESARPLYIWLNDFPPSKAQLAATVALLFARQASHLPIRRPSPA